MICANELDDVIRMTRVDIVFGESRRVVPAIRLGVAVMMTVIVSEHDAHAVAIVGNTHGMFAVRRREQNGDARNDVVSGAEKSQEAQARGEATEPLRALCSGFHRRAW